MQRKVKAHRQPWREQPTTQNLEGTIKSYQEAKGIELGVRPADILVLHFLPLCSQTLFFNPLSLSKMNNAMFKNPWVQLSVIPLPLSFFASRIGVYFPFLKSWLVLGLVCTNRMGRRDGLKLKAQDLSFCFSFAVLLSGFEEVYLRLMDD